MIFHKKETEKIELVARQGIWHSCKSGFVSYLGLVHGPGVGLPGRSLRQTLSDVLVVVFYVESRDRLGQPVPTERAVPTQEGPTGTPNGVTHFLSQEALRFLCKKEIAATMSKTIRG